eukprot:360508-Chlamydomonas_euryale.AAC.11
MWHVIAGVRRWFVEGTFSGWGTYCEWMRIACRGRWPRGTIEVKTGSRPGSRGLLLIQVQAWLMVLFAMIVIWRQKIWKLPVVLRLEKPMSRVKSKECVLGGVPP